MSSRKDALWRWWSKFDQVQQLSDIMSKSLMLLLDDYLAANPVDSSNRGSDQQVGFDEYIMHRAVTEVCCPLLARWRTLSSTRFCLPLSVGFLVASLRA